MTPPQQAPPQLSADGRYWWDGARWLPAVSGDGRWRWNGRQWEATAAEVKTNWLGQPVDPSGFPIPAANPTNVIRTAGGLRLRPSGQSAWSSILAFAALGFVLFTIAQELTRSDLAGLLIAGVPFLLLCVMTLAHWLWGRLFATPDAVWVSYGFGTARTCFRAELKAIELRKRKFTFVRHDGSVAFSVSTTWYPKEHISALGELLQVPTAYSEAGSTV